MFGLLKNKISSFINSLTGREQKKETSLQSQQEVFLEKESGFDERSTQSIAATQATSKASADVSLQKSATSKESFEKEAKNDLAVVPASNKRQADGQTISDSKPQPKATKALPEKPSSNKPGLVKEDKVSPDLYRLEKKAYSGKRQFAPKISLGTSVKSFFSNEITIGEAEISDLLEELELSLLEADVAYEVSSEVVSQLRSKLVGMKVPKGQVGQKTKEAILETLASIMESDRKFDFVAKVKSLGKPAKVLFVGPNGAGKTTTMAKLAKMLMDAGLSVVFAASDTFRAAAIEQTEAHAAKLGIKTIKSKYGADPASVAFDAINFARSSNIDVVLIDSAGRQDTNSNLLAELSKINRVAKPDLKIYIGESIGGNSVIDQIRAFNNAIGIDGAILTKIDCDAKGGTAISIAKATGIPVIFLGTGQGYYDLIPFDARKIAEEIMN
ncbi:MAG: signal recognition particle-docking protein FtsY [Candidatus Anstonellaceae archaeon]